MEMNNNLITSDLHVSAIVQIGKISSEINLRELAEYLCINDRVLYIEYGSEISKGDNLKKIKKIKKIKKFFYNQVTLHIWLGKRINMKIFNNGRIQMTGIKNELQGNETIQLFIEEINKISDENKIKIFDSTEIYQVEPIQTVLINSDFDIYFEVNREILHRLIVDRGYYSSYEPCTYPGVNIKYYYNPILNNFGICDCDKPCNGKGKDNTCKKITIAVFKSGKIIITGGRNKENINSAYKFITEFINENKDKILIK
tara:strand:+ start:767 stop:1537 length:771 start_codon:yes stop_codon:yes gene_type:complete